MMNRPGKVSICIFGLNRSLSHTHESITRHLFEPLRAHGVGFSVYCCLVRLDAPFTNTRSSELGAVPEVSEADLLPGSHIAYVDQKTIDSLVDWVSVFAHGDIFGEITGSTLGVSDSSTKNHIRSLYCLRSAFRMIPAADADHPVFFMRPDLDLLEPLSLDLIFSALEVPPSRRANGSTTGVAVVPSWQSWNGLNDRFAVCSGGFAASSYAERVGLLEDYLRMSASPIHPETFLLHALMLRRVQVFPLITSRMVRIRAGSRVHLEEFEQGSFSWSHSSESWRLLVGMNQSLSRDLQVSQSNLSAQERLRDELEGQLAEAHAEAERLSGELAAGRQLQASLQEQASHAEELVAQLAEAHAKVERLSGELSEQQARSADSDLASRCEELESQLQAVRSEAEMILDQLFQVQEELERCYLSGLAPLPAEGLSVEPSSLPGAASASSVLCINASRRRLLSEVQS